MNWDSEKAKKYMERVGMDHIRDGLTEEGVDLIKAADFPENYNTKKDFCQTFENICWWDKDMLREAAFTAMNPAFD